MRISFLESCIHTKDTRAVFMVLRYGKVQKEITERDRFLFHVKKVKKKNFSFFELFFFENKNKEKRN